MAAVSVVFRTHISPTNDSIVQFLKYDSENPIKYSIYLLIETRSCSVALTGLELTI